MNTTQDPQNEGLPLDPNAYATKLDIANLRTEFKDEISAVRNEIANPRPDFKDEIAALKNEYKKTRLAIVALTRRLEEIEKRMISLQNQMTVFIASQAGILIALVSLLLA